MGDALSICLLQSRGFNEDGFAETHPHGTLGRRLLVKVTDVMSGLSDAPVVHRNILVKEALVTISTAGLGFVVVVDGERRPLGVFTDGDLRRCLDRDIDIQKVSIAEVMTKAFAVIKDSQLAVAAVDLMERRKISTLPVIDNDGRLVGALNMRQRLQAGVV
jgi:arabinose-5-phosphate isomerase